jgi:hypothetical protein
MVVPANTVHILISQVGVFFKLPGGRPKPGEDGLIIRCSAVVTVVASSSLLRSLGCCFVVVTAFAAPSRPSPRCNAVESWANLVLPALLPDQSHFDLVSPDKYCPESTLRGGVISYLLHVMCAEIAGLQAQVDE